MTQRMKDLMAALPKEVDAVLITSPINRRYYTGFSSSAGALLMTRGSAFFLVDSRYLEGAQHTVQGCQVILQKKYYEQMGALIKENGIHCLGIESDFVTIQQLHTLEEKLDAVDLYVGEDICEAIGKQRRVKTPEELACIARAQDIADKTFTHILDYIRPGRTEREIALEMEFYSRKQGSRGEAFPFIVLAGANTSKPHGTPSDYAVQPGDFVLMDFGCLWEGYCSDMTRTVVVGQPSLRQRLIYDTVLRAQMTALDSIGPGAVCAQVDSIAREVIDATEFQGRFTHSLGHSLGLEVHENPNFSPTCNLPLAPGFVLSVEPGIYLPGECGVRIEDLVAVTQEGYHNFTASPKELVIC